MEYGIWSGSWLVIKIRVAFHVRICNLMLPICTGSCDTIRVHHPASNSITSKSDLLASSSERTWGRWRMLIAWVHDIGFSGKRENPWKINQQNEIRETARRIYAENPYSSENHPKSTVNFDHGTMNGHETWFQFIVNFWQCLWSSFLRVRLPCCNFHRPSLEWACTYAGVVVLRE